MRPAKAGNPKRAGPNSAASYRTLQAPNYHGPVAKFDQDSGQVFTEMEVPFNKKQYSDWIAELKTPGLLKRARNNETGARSLFEMAKNKTARQFRELDADHFELVPWSIAEKVWQEVVSL